MEGFAGREKIAIAEGEEVGAFEGEEREAAVKGWEFVQIEGEHEDPIEETVPARREPRVHHVTLVETGIHGRGEKGRTSSVTSDGAGWTP